MIGMLGAALGQEILGFIVQRNGWRIGMEHSAWFGIAVLVMTYAFVKDAPNESAASAAAPARRSMQGLARLLLSPSVILAGLIGGTIYSAGLSFAMLWGVPFFESRLGIDLAPLRSAPRSIPGGSHRAPAFG
jgi:hypothetical protein